MIYEIFAEPRVAAIHVKIKRLLALREDKEEQEEREIRYGNSVVGIHAKLTVERY